MVDITGSQDSLLVERKTHDQKVVSLNPGRSIGRIFFSRINSYSVSIPPLCYHSGTLKTLVILPKVQVAGYT